MYILFAIAGFITLIAIMWCLRMVRKGQTSLQKDKERWQEKFRQEETKLNKEQQEITAQEQTHLLNAAIQDLLRLENRTDATVTRNGNTIRIQLEPQTVLSVSLSAREQKITGLGTVLHSPTVWSLTRSGETKVYTRLDSLMRTLVAIIRGEEPDELETMDEFRKRPF